VDSALAAVVLNGKHWGVPISNGNHLMLIYNKNLIATAPANTDELMTKGLELTTGEQYGLVYNQTEPFWQRPGWAALVARSLPRTARRRRLTRPR